MPIGKMSIERMRDAAQLLREFGNAKMASELEDYADSRESALPNVTSHAQPHHEIKCASKSGKKCNCQVAKTR